MRFSDDEVETIRLLCRDWGNEYGLAADEKKVAALAKKLKAPAWRSSSYDWWLHKQKMKAGQATLEDWFKRSA